MAFLSHAVTPDDPGISDAAPAVRLTAVIGTAHLAHGVWRDAPVVRHGANGRRAGGLRVER